MGELVQRRKLYNTNKLAKQKKWATLNLKRSIVLLLLAETEQR